MEKKHQYGHLAITQEEMIALKAAVDGVDKVTMKALGFKASEHSCISYADFMVLIANHGAELQRVIKK